MATSTLRKERKRLGFCDVAILDYIEGENPRMNEKVAYLVRQARQEAMNNGQLPITDLHDTTIAQCTAMYKDRLMGWKRRLNLEMSSYINWRNQHERECAACRQGEPCDELRSEAYRHVLEVQHCVRQAQGAARSQARYVRLANCKKCNLQGKDYPDCAQIGRARLYDEESKNLVRRPCPFHEAGMMEFAQQIQSLEELLTSEIRAAMLLSDDVCAFIKERSMKIGA